MLGGVLFGLGRAVPFVADAASYAISGLLLMAVSARPAVRDGRGHGGVAAGLRWLWSMPDVVRVVVFAGMINLVASAAQVAVVVVLRLEGTPAATIGVVMA